MEKRWRKKSAVFEKTAEKINLDLSSPPFSRKTAEKHIHLPFAPAPSYNFDKYFLQNLTLCPRMFLIMLTSEL